MGQILRRVPNGDTKEIRCLMRLGANQMYRHSRLVRMVQRCILQMNPTSKGLNPKSLLSVVINTYVDCHE
jgi:hypothetical protein